ncbi:hypothetical protein TSO221_33775 [Azospirillum sp. TSO22-1]|nr:hypothetical protein TSO221_33775 [Azospirillum sp. TSO22-1]
MPAYTGIGNLFAQQGAHDDAAAAFRRALEIDPASVDARLSLGSVLTAAGRPDLAFVEYRTLVEQQPSVGRFRFLAGTAALVADDLAQAEHHLRQVLLQAPDDVAAMNNLALCLSRQGRVTESAFYFRAATDRQPDYAAAWFGLAAVLEKGLPGPDLDAAYRKVNELRPDDPGTASNRLMLANYRDDLDPAAVFARHRAWGEALEARVAPMEPPPHGDGRRLRIGYVSPDFRAHSIAMFLLPLLEHHDRTRVELFAYANIERADGITRRVRGLVDHWRDIRERSDDEAAATIRQDGIDVLIDLTGHTAGHRLGVFARRPARAQATWLGYPASTGLSAIDVRFTDAIADPPGATDAWHSERLERLDDCFLCYSPLEPAPDPLPRAADGPVTFGSFNALAKLNPSVAALWARVLNAVPGSRLLLKTAPLADRAVRRRVQGLFAEHGVAADRLDLRGHLPNGAEHLALYGAMDIALDPFPYNGTTTTCEALWMGVPVLTLPGAHHAARVSASLLTAVGLPELIAGSPDDFVERAHALAADRARLEEWRRGLRPMMQGSRLCDAAAFARRFEERCLAL